MNKSEKNVGKFEELSLGEFYIEIANYFQFYRKKWWLVLLLIVLTVGGAFIYNNKQESYYSGKLTFLVEGTSGGASSAILSQLGLGGGGGSGPNIDRVIEIAKSNQVGENVLNTRVAINGESDLLGNFIIDFSTLRDDWKNDDSPLAGETFKDSFPAEEELIQARLRKILLNRIYNGGGPDGALCVFEPDPITSIVGITGKTANEELTIQLINTLFDELNKFYTQKLYGRQFENYELTKSLSDSLKNELDRIQYAVSRAQDRGTGLILSRDQLKLQRLRQDEVRLATSYAEAYRQTQIAAFSIRSQSSSLEVIDRPFAPLYFYKIPLLELLLLSLVVGVFISLVIIFLLYFRKIILDDVAKIH